MALDQKDHGNGQKPSLTKKRSPGRGGPCRGGRSKGGKKKTDNRRERREEKFSRKGSRNNGERLQKPQKGRGMIAEGR